MSHEIRTEPTVEKGWLDKVIKSVREEVADWPEQKKISRSKDETLTLSASAPLSTR